MWSESICNAEISPLNISFWFWNSSTPQTGITIKLWGENFKYDLHCLDRELNFSLLLNLYSHILSMIINKEVVMNFQSRGLFYWQCCIYPNKKRWKQKSCFMIYALLFLIQTYVNNKDITFTCMRFILQHQN